MTPASKKQIFEEKKRAFEAEISKIASNTIDAYSFVTTIALLEKLAEVQAMRITSLENQIKIMEKDHDNERKQTQEYIDLLELSHLLKCSKINKNNLP